MRIPGAPKTALIAVLAGCAGLSPAAPSGVEQAAAVQLGSGTWRSFSVTGYGAGIARAKNGDFWGAFSYYPDFHTLARVTPHGKLTTHTVGFYPQELAIDKAGNFWCTSTSNNRELIAEISPHFQVKTFALSQDAFSGITVGEDGNVWFPESFAVGKITPDGTLTEYKTPRTGGQSGITSGPNGYVWFFLTTGLASINPKSGAFNVYPNAYGANQGPIVAGSDGALWFIGGLRQTKHLQALVRYDPLGNKSTAYKLPWHFASSEAPGGLVQASDGTFWYGAQFIRGRIHEHQAGAGLVRFDPQTKTFTGYKAPNGYDWPWDLVPGPKGTIWAAAGGAVYELTPSGSQ